MRYKNISIKKLLPTGLYKNPRIQIKYGGLSKAEGTKEFSELQELLNAGRS